MSLFAYLKKQLKYYVSLLNLGACGAAAVCIVFFQPPVAGAQMLHPDKPDTAKKCAICHFQWVYPFFKEHRDGELVAMPKDDPVGAEEMCFSCHDGSVADSRDTVFMSPGHKAGVTPSANVVIPETFPLDQAGRLQCTTCHSPHAIFTSPGSDTKERVFFRALNKNSSLCTICHVTRAGGPAKGSHSVNVSAPARSPEILEHGGRFGDAMPNQVICETCHIAHGGVNNKFLVLSAEDTSRSILCVACHGATPGAQKGRAPATRTHPVNVLPQKSIIPVRWAQGEKVTVGNRGELVCRTCHSPHGAVDKTKLLTRPNDKDSLCMECHREKQSIVGSRHDLRRNAAGKNVKGQSGSGAGPCSACHVMHADAGKLVWSIHDNDESGAEEYCVSCHRPGGRAEKAVPKGFSHPMDMSYPSLHFIRSEMKIRCATCHDLHTPLPVYPDPNDGGAKHSSFLHQTPAGSSGVCIECHARYGAVAGTDHDLRITAPDARNAYGQTTQQGGVCSPCHLAHNARRQKYLWSGPTGPGLLTGWELPNTSKNNVMTGYCTGCHAPQSIAESHIPRLGLHPKTKIADSSNVFSFEQIRNEFPLFTDAGELAAGGDIACSTCHNPHQWTPRSSAKAPGIKVEGDATNSFLRPNLHTKFCAACHGKEALVKFKFFHSPASREKKQNAVPFKALTVK